MPRKVTQQYPDFKAFITEIETNGINAETLQKIIQRHKPNSLYNRELYDRYMGVDGKLPIHKRKPRYNEANAINNKIGNDFFGEIVDFKTGYFVGKPIGYSYSKTEEAEEVTGGAAAVKKATKALTDFVTRNNMYGVDLEIIKLASIYGYAGRLFYIDPEGNERVMPVHGYETIIISSTDISEPEYAVRYFYTLDVNNAKSWTVEFYDNTNVYTYTGMSLGHLTEVEVRPHLFDYCPLQGVANNSELMGDAEKVLPLIDDYDKVISDNSNEIESFVHALMVVCAAGEDVEGEIRKANNSGMLVVRPVGTMQNAEPVKWVTKQINDGFTEHHLERIEKNIYRFSKTPNLNDQAFGAASGVSLKFKLHGLETKCGMCQAAMMNAAVYMWKVLASAWVKKTIAFDPLQVVMNFERNFPLDHLSNAQAAQAMITAGVPEEIAWDICIPEIDDVDYVKEIKEKEKEDVTSFYENDEPNDEQPGNEQPEEAALTETEAEEEEQ